MTRSVLIAGVLAAFGAVGGASEPAGGSSSNRHWAFQPVQSHSAPPVDDADWCRTSIDRFILAKLEERGLTPSPPADRRTLLRRVSYDLIGLPPTPDEVEAFVGDDSPDAFARTVERLLASPHYGERWGRHWLDVARYADTKDGVLMYGDDRIRPYAYTYRDYVIRAVNEDTPFDRFVHEQLAADLIEPPVESWRLAAMGFLTLGRMFDNNIHDVIDDRIDTVTRGLLGLTVSCARCHDHKYDPIPTADYYSLYGVFASSDAPLELPLIGKPMDSPGLQEFEKEAVPKWEELRKFLDEQYTLLQEDARQRVAEYLVHVATTEPDPLETAIFFRSLQPEDLRPQIVARWRRLLNEQAQPDDPVWGLWHDLMRLDDLPQQAKGILDQWKGGLAGTRRGQVNPLVLEALSGSAPTDRAGVARAYGDLLRRVYGQSRQATASEPPQGEARQQLLALVAGPESPTWFPKTETWHYMSRGPKDKFSGMRNELDKLAVKSQHAPPRAMVLYDTEQPYDPQIFVRGNPAQTGEHVPRRFLEILAGNDREPFPHGSGRLDLARAITSPEHPLTARVIVNRVWMHHFGEPLVDSPGDFGVRTPPPSHPELLDDLALRLQQNGWSLKALHREIVLSAAYQQVSLDQPECRELDPENRLLWRMNRRRLDLELMRDSLLAISGRLDRAMGGRPVDAAGDPHNRRRTVYGLVDRQSLPALYRAFDFASPDQSADRRPKTTVPQQALFGMNSPFVIEQARSLAARPEVVEAADSPARIAALYRLVLCREPTPDETDVTLQFLAGAQDRAGLDGWQQLAQVLLMTNELMFVD